ncbi:Vacuolar protein sorting-associated protein 52 like protein [Fusarium oxysporum f. sp. cubense race 1]|uniref:Vacuolar protein sorting-associated protein 52 like protein n=1 Tax=Fusarium oxysporum f. sp. cubense (strain race 1) TaxID=1229664 RepID=N4TKD3_FUSC1|nr:Vacuolar protein sorting-associated protein 52 like protein [Fusarium oxysporum f. sp. cubense race 1]
MWLDRLAGGPASSPGPSTPQPGGRVYPKRTSSTLSPYVTSQRPGISPRGSSLSLVSNDSTSSLLSSSRRPNGSNLRQASTIETGPDSLEVLETLLAGLSSDRDQADKKTVINQDDINFDALFGGLSLKELATSEPPDTTTISNRKPKTAEEGENDRTKLEDLHRSIEACDDVLNSVEINLANFRNDLAMVSADIESLQTRSTALNRRLENRKQVEKALGPLVEELSLPPEVISKISEGHIDETWAKMLAELDRRSTLFKKKSETQTSNAAKDLEPILEKLTFKAIERIRDFIVAQIKALRSPHINAQIIQQQSFLRYKDLYTFLHKHHPTLANEIALAYMNTMRWYYLNQFSRNRAPGPPHDAFNLGRRIDLLKTNNQTALSSYLAEEDQTTHYLEVIMDRHCDSVRHLSNAMPAKPSRAEAAKLSAAPHVVTQRFGQLLHGLLALSTDAGDDEPVVSSLRRLRSEVETFLTRHAELFGDKRKSGRFLYNNYSLILTIISDANGKLADEQQEHFEELKTQYQETS